MTAGFSTSVHYWRTPPGRWEQVVDRLASAGFRTVDTYVPWGVHEVEPGRFEFGQDDPALDLPRFARLLSERGLGLIMRPGPQVNAELNFFGLPERIVRDPAVQALGPRGTPVWCPNPPVFFPCPSYASERYLEETRIWFRAVGATMASVAASGAPGPAGPVILVQVDNEASLFFRDAPFDQDYRPEALAMWGRWLEERGLPARQAPRDREDGIEGLRLMMEWVRFRRWMMLEALGRMKVMLVEAGFAGVPFCHNLPPSGLWRPLGIRDLASVVDVVTTDIYATANTVSLVRDQVLSLRSLQTEPMAAEVSCGTVFFAPQITSFDNRFVCACALAWGLASFNLYMGSGRDRWLGGLVPEGGEREGADLLHFFQRLVKLLESYRHDDTDPIAGAEVVVPEDYLVHSIAAFPIPGASPTLLASLAVPLQELLPGDEWEMGRPVQYEWLARLRDCQDALQGHSIQWVISDGIGPRPSDVPVLVPTFRYLTAGVLASLLLHVEAGGFVIAGPDEPVLDERLEPLPEAILARWVSARESGRLVVVRSLEEEPACRILKDRARAIAQGLPWEVSIRAPSAQILAHAPRDGKGSWASWIVCTGTGGGERTVLVPKRGWGWNHALGIREKRTGGEFVQGAGGNSEKLMLDLSGKEVHLVLWSRQDVG